MTKSSNVSKKNLEAMQDGLKKQEKPSLSSLNFENRGKEFEKRKSEKIEALKQATKPPFTP